MKITMILKHGWIVVLPLLLSCQPKKDSENNMKPLTPKDQHSFAEPEKARVTHLDWKAKIDFDTKTITATATWKIEMADDADIITFDSKGLKIESIFLNESTPAEFKT